MECILFSLVISFVMNKVGLLITFCILCFYRVFVAFIEVLLFLNATVGPYLDWFVIVLSFC